MTYIDSVIEKEFKEAAKTTKKQYCSIVSYFFTAMNVLETKDPVYTDFHHKENNKLATDLALSYTRDYIWFDEKTF